MPTIRDAGATSLARINVHRCELRGVLSLSEDTIKFRLGRDEHTETVRVLS